jgi:hypothetical protein
MRGLALSVAALFGPAGELFVAAVDFFLASCCAFTSAANANINVSPKKKLQTLFMQSSSKPSFHFWSSEQVRPRF